MDELNSIQVFITVVEQGSFAAAGRVLHKSTSAVARQIGWLEAELNARLLNRTTRQQSLTEAGKLYYERVSQLNKELTQLKSQTRSAHETAEGLLRVQLRGSTATTVVVPALPELLHRFPGLELDILVSDERVDLVSNNIDVAIWSGELPDTELVARKLSPSSRLMCASPQYLARAGCPTIPDDLRDHDCLLFRAPAYGREWTLERAGQRSNIPVKGSIQSENGPVLVRAALLGIGLVVMPEWIVREHLQSGALVRVMQDYEVSPIQAQAPLYAVFHNSRQVSRRVRVFVDYLVEIFDDKKIRVSVPLLRETQRTTASIAVQE